MVATVMKRDGDSVTVSVTVRLDGPMLESEEAIQEALNEAGMLLEQENLGRFDTDGSPIQVGSVRLTSEGRSPQIYGTPYGPVHVERHVYQTAQGGKNTTSFYTSTRWRLCLVDSSANCQSAPPLTEFIWFSTRQLPTAGLLPVSV